MRSIVKPMSSLADSLMRFPIMPPPGLEPPPHSMIPPEPEPFSPSSTLPDGTMAPLPDGNAVPVSSLYKTKLCKFYIQGLCTKGARCSFAHGTEDLDKTAWRPRLSNKAWSEKWQSQPIRSVKQLRSGPTDLKTEMCHFHARGLCPFSDACCFAHSTEELQIWRTRSAPTELKTEMCHFHARGLCPFGEACCFAHSAEELQEDAPNFQCASFRNPRRTSQPTKKPWPRMGHARGFKDFENENSDEETVTTFETTENEQSGGESEDTVVDSPSLQFSVQAHARFEGKVPQLVPIAVAPSRSMPCPLDLSSEQAGARMPMRATIFCLLVGDSPGDSGLSV